MDDTGDVRKQLVETLVELFRDVRADVQAREGPLVDVFTDLEARENTSPRDPREALPHTTYGRQYQEIRNLAEAKKDPVRRVALEEWDRKERLLGNRVDRREKRSADLINQIFNLVGFYSAFQGLVLTAVAQLLSASNTIGSQCGKIWFPILLTVVATLVTIIAIWKKFTNISELERSIFDEKRAQGEAIKFGDQIKARGDDFRFRNLKDLNVAKAKTFWRNKIGVIFALVVFTAVFILSYFAILCDLWEIKSLKDGL